MEQSMHVLKSGRHIELNTVATIPWRIYSGGTVAERIEAMVKPEGLDALTVAEAREIIEVMEDAVGKYWRENPTAPPKA